MEKIEHNFGDFDCFCKYSEIYQGMHIVAVAEINGKQWEWAIVTSGANINSISKEKLDSFLSDAKKAFERRKEKLNGKS